MSDQTSIKIAVVGMACQLPGACNINEYWELVRNGKRCLTTFTDEQLRRSGIKEDLIQNPKYIRTKGVLPDIDLFDADFFGFTPKEAAVTDPQHRFFLECAWQALEDAGYDSLRYPGRKTEDHRTAVLSCGGAETGRSEGVGGKNAPGGS